MGTESADTDGIAVVIAARNEADRITDTVLAVRGAFPGAAVWVADDASEDGTAERALAAGAQVVSRGKPHGKGANVTAACEAALRAAGDPAGSGDAGGEPASGEGAPGIAGAPAVVLLCDGDLGASAARLTPLVAAVAAGECELAVAAFSRRVGGGFGLALGFARWAIRRLCGVETTAPISGQRALRLDALHACLPFAAGFGMEIGITVDAVRGGYRLHEYELDLEHRATGRSAAGFAHRAVQLRDFARVYASRMRSGGRRAGGAA